MYQISLLNTNYLKMVLELALKQHKVKRLKYNMKSWQKIKNLIWQNYVLGLSKKQVKLRI